MKHGLHIIIMKFPILKFCLCLYFPTSQNLLKYVTENDSPSKTSPLKKGFPILKIVKHVYYIPV